MHCTSHSAFGNRQGYQSKQAKYFWAWCADCNEMDHDGVIFENVQQAGLAEIVDCLSRKYVLSFYKIVSPTTMGSPSERVRFMALFHSQRIMPQMFHDTIVERHRRLVEDAEVE